MSVTIHEGQAQAYDFLKEHKVGVLATVDPNGDPHAAAIYYLIDSSFNISFVTKTGTKKADNLERNNHAVLVVYESGTQTTVQITGTVSKVTDLERVNKILAGVMYASLDTALTDEPPITKLQDGEYVAFELSPKLVHMAVFTSEKPGDYSDIFKTFIPEES